MYTLIEKFKGVVIGSALGDAIGKCMEDVVEEEVYRFYGGKVRSFVEPHPSSPAYGYKPWEVSDETTVAIILLESIVEKKSINVHDFLKRLLIWYQDEKNHRYPDPALLTALGIFLSGQDPAKHMLKSNSVEGILRSIMVGLFHYYDPKLSSEGSKLVSLLTHRGESISDGASFLGATISYLISGEFDINDPNDKIRFTNTVKKFITNPLYSKTIDTVQDLLLEGSDIDTAIKNIGIGSFVFEALPLALFIFLAYSRDPTEAFWHGVNSYGEFGGDTDSIGFLVGSFLGAYYGIEVFPRNLVEELENSSRYINLAERLYDITENMIIRR